MAIFIFDSMGSSARGGEDLCGDVFGYGGREIYPNSINRGNFCIHMIIFGIFREVILSRNNNINIFAKISSYFPNILHISQMNLPIIY